MDKFDEKAREILVSVRKELDSPIWNGCKCSRCSSRRQSVQDLLAQFGRDVERETREAEQSHILRWLRENGYLETADLLEATLEAETALSLVRAAIGESER